MTHKNTAKDQPLDENILQFQREVLAGTSAIFLLDTGAITNLYHQYGEDFLKEENLIPGNLYVIPNQVEEELRNQYEKGDYASLSEEQCTELGLALGTRKVPYQLMNLFWAKTGEGLLLQEEVKISPEKEQEIRQKMAEGSLETGNTRIGQGDRSLIVLAEQLAGEYPVIIVSPDSDIPNTLGAMNLEGVHYLHENSYAQLVRL